MRKFQITETYQTLSVSGTEIAGQYVLTTWGGGVAVSLEHNNSAVTVYVQGEDAARFIDEMDALQVAHPDWDNWQVYAEMWRQYVQF